MRNEITFKVYGRMALFTDPITRMGGEKSSYAVPTYQALKGIVESIYWKPTILWYIDEMRVMKVIRTQSRGVKPKGYYDKVHNLSIYKYLSDVCYEVKAHFEFNLHRPDLACDRNENKHHNIAKRMVERGGRRDIFLGTRECQGYVEPVSYGEAPGFYDDTPAIPLGTMFHGLIIPTKQAVICCKLDSGSRLWNMASFILFDLRPVPWCGIFTKGRPKSLPLKISAPLNGKPPGWKENAYELDCAVS